MFGHRAVAVGFVYQFAEAAFEVQGFAGLGADGLDRPGVFVAQAFQGGGRERVFLATYPFQFGSEGVGIQFGRRLERQARCLILVSISVAVEPDSSFGLLLRRSH